jgi:hypothetical protein
MPAILYKKTAPSETPPYPHPFEPSILDPENTLEVPGPLYCGLGVFTTTSVLYKTILIQEPPPPAKT